MKSICLGMAALFVLSGIAVGQYPSWVDANGWTPGGGYYTSYIGHVNPNYPYAGSYSMYDPYGMWSGYASYSSRSNIWGYGMPGGYRNYGYSYQNPYRY